MSPSFVTLHLLVSEIAKCIVVLQKLTVIIVVCSLKSMCVPSFIVIGYCLSELYGHLCPYRNAWPEAVYCCFTRTRHCLPNFWYVYYYSWISISSQCFIPQFSLFF